MTKTRTKQQHYVSRFYLDYFKDADGMVWTIDSATDSVWPASPKNTGRQANFYSPKNEAGDFLDGIEDWLTGVESKAAPLYKKVIKGQVLVDQERADFAVFLASLYSRGPANIRASAEFRGYAAQTVYNKFLGDRAEFDRLFDRMDESNGTTTSKEDRDKIFEFANDRDAYTLEVDRNSGLSGISVADRLAPILFDMKWDLVVVEDEHLITSDNPMIRVSPPDDYHPIYGDGGFMGKRAWVTIPLSPDRLLQLTWSDKPEGVILKADKQNVQVLNKQRAYFSERYLFSSRKDDEIRRLGREYKDSRPTIEMSGSEKMAKVNVNRSSQAD